MNIPVTTAVVGGFAAYSAVAFLYKRLKRALSRNLRRPNKTNVDAPTLPKELWSQILSEFVIDYPSDRDLLNLSLVNKSTHDFILDMYSRRNSSVRWNSPYTATPKLCHFIRRRNREASNKVFNGKANPLYGPWMDNNVIRSPETFWKFLVLLPTKPMWLRLYEAEVPVANPTGSNIFINVRHHFKRLKPLVSVLRFLSLTPVLDLILKKFQRGEYAWTNIWNFNILYWRSPFNLLPIVIMLMANQALELNFNEFNGLWIRTAIYLVLSALQYGGASIIWPTLILAIVLIGSQLKKDFVSREVVWFTCFFSIIGTIILFPSTIVLVPYAIYYFASAYLLPKDFAIQLNFNVGSIATLIGTYLIANNYI